MGGATSIIGYPCRMSVIKGAFSQWANTIDWTVRCDWLQVASVVSYLQLESFNFYLTSFIV